MSETKRTLQNVTQEYQLACMRAGQAHYQLTVLQEEIRGLNRSLRALNKEAARLNKKEEPMAQEGAPDVGNQA